MNDIFDPATGEMIDDESSALVPTETDTVMVRADAAPQLIDPMNLPDLDNMEAGFSLAQQYVKFTQEGQTMRGVFLGFNQMKSKQGGTKPIAIFQNKQGVWANAGDNLVNQIINLPKGTPLQVTYKGEIRTQSGNNVKSFEVRILNVAQKPKTPDLPADVAQAINAATAHSVSIPSKQNGNTQKRAVVRTARIRELNSWMVASGHADEKTAPFKVCTIAANYGFTEITDANLGEVLGALQDHYAAQELQPA